MTKGIYSNFAENITFMFEMKVFVINMHGEPLMPCSQRKARLLLKEGKAKVVQREPFTIQLLYGSTGYKQDITIGVDTGHNDVGVSVVTSTKELFSSVFTMRNNISENMTTRRMYRRTRRNRLRYRKPRFNNRSSSIRKGRLAPSVIWKVEAHKRLINFYQSRLPKSRLVLETGTFDMQKMQNPNITNTMYQKGRMYGYANTKAYVLSRDNYSCQCGLKGCSNRLEVHHIKFRSQGGSDAPDNLITLCDKHHKMLHEDRITLNLKKHKSLKSATTMNVIRKRLLQYYPDAIETFGYVTKENRQSIDLPKSHENDAFVIAGGIDQERVTTQNFKFKQANNRSIGINRKGYAPTARKVRYPIQSGDIIKYEGLVLVSKGNLNKGNSVLIEINGKKKAVNSKKVELIYNRKNIQNVSVKGVAYITSTLRDECVLRSVNKEKFLELVSDEKVKTIQQLKDLAAKIREEQKTVEKSLKTLRDAGILDAEGNFTEFYKNLEGK